MMTSGENTGHQNEAGNNCAADEILSHETDGTCKVARSQEASVAAGNRLIAALLLSFGLGQALAAGAGYLWLLGAVFLLALLYFDGGNHKCRLAMALLLFTGGYFRAQQSFPSSEAIATFAKDSCHISEAGVQSSAEVLCELSGKIVSTPQRPSSGQLRFELETTASPSIAVLLTSAELPWKNSFDLNSGDAMRLTVALTFLRKSNKELPPLMSYENFLLRRGISASGKVLAIKDIIRASTPNAWQRMLSPLRDNPAQVEVAGVVIAAAAGDESLLSNEIAMIFRKAGLYHVLVVSGFHLVVIYGLFFFCFSRLLGYLPRLVYVVPIKIPAAILAGAVSILYTVFTGAELATQRALYALLLVILAQIYFRKGSFGRNYLLVMFVIITVFPLAFLEAGFQLSFAAVAGLAAAASLIRRSNQLKSLPLLRRKFAELMILSTGPAMLTTPISLFWFQTLCPLTVFYNVIFGAIFGLVFILGGGIFLLWDACSAQHVASLPWALFWCAEKYLRVLEWVVNEVDAGPLRFRVFEPPEAEALGMLACAAAAILAGYLWGSYSTLAQWSRLWQNRAADLQLFGNDLKISQQSDKDN